MAGLVAALLAQAGGLSTDAASSGFVTRSGAQLLLEGRPYRFSGLNIYNANSDGWCWYAMNTGSALDDALGAIGPDKNAFRAWFFQPLATSAGARDWSAFDHTLSVAAAHGYRVIVTLTDQWGECGVAEDGGNSYFKTKDWYTNGYTSVDAGMLASYRDWVSEVVTRYRDNPKVLMWQLINEAEVKESANSGCLPGTESRDTLITWATDVSGLIKTIDSNHLVSLGTIGGGQCGAQYLEYADVHAIATIDVCEYHDYSPETPIPGDQWNGLQFRIDQCNALNKPIFVGEAGVRPIDVGGTLQARADVLQAKMDAQAAAGVQGFLGWAWSSLGSTLDNYDIGPSDPALDALAIVIDSDGDGCSDTRESQASAGSQMSGGLRNPKLAFDYFNPSHDGKNRVDDVLLVVQAYFHDDNDGSPGLPPYAAGYHPDRDRTLVGPELWNTGPPNGQERVDDILNMVHQYFHDCA
jgi:hypothetical protein